MIKWIGRLLVRILKWILPKRKYKPSVYDAFRMASEHLGDEMHHRVSYNDAWLSLVKNDYPKSQSSTQLKDFTITREPPRDDPEAWRNL